MVQDISPSSGARRKAGVAIPVEPAANRASNAEESAPETLVPDVVRMALAPGPDEEAVKSRRHLIEHRAYQIAQGRDFAPGCELDDWLQAEAEIDAAPPQQTSAESQFTG